MEQPVLFLDLGRTTGWAEGAPGGRLTFGSITFAPEGSSHGEVFGMAMKWLAERWSAWKPRTVVYEAPIPPYQKNGQTNVNTTAVLFGLPAIVEGVANRVGIYDVRMAHVDDVRRFHFGKKLFKRDNPKAQVIAHLQGLGYEIRQHDAADALAGLLFAHSIIAPRVKPAATAPLFADADLRMRGVQF